MQCFLLDADGKQNNDALIRKWMWEISDLAHEAEDIIETYILKVHKKEVENGIVEDLIWLMCFWKDTITLHKVGSQISSLTSKISKLSSRLQTYGVSSSYGLQSLQGTRNLLGEQRRTYSHDRESYVVGLEEKASSLSTKLIDGPQKIVVVYGMGGISKTTLARQLFHDSSIKTEFAGAGWAYISQQFELGAVCRDILNGLLPDERDATSELAAPELIGKLSDMLLRNKYLVVLDDVWKAGDWDRLEPAFPIDDVSFCSKIVITTRNPQILSRLGEVLVSSFETTSLDADSAFKLLQNKGNFTIDGLPDPAMEGVAQKMLEHCDGNPLAIVALGGVLATKRSLPEWESVLDNLQLHLQGDESYSRVYEVLAIGYYDLPYIVKPCFLHMAHFPEDYAISVERIYNLWIAEAIVSTTQERIGSKRTLEDIANNYLNQLVQKGMIQVFEMNVDGTIKTCRLHDLIRDKCLEIAREESFVQVVVLPEGNNASGDGDGDTGNERVRRLTMHLGNQSGQSVLEASSRSVSSLRSFVFISTNAETDRHEITSEWIRNICEKFKLLRILDFEGVVLGGILPSEVGNLIFLTYLSLRGTHITELPSSIGNLRSLLILDLRVKKFKIKLPNVLWKMVSLRHLYLPWKILSKEDGADVDQGYMIEDGTNLKLDSSSRLERVDNVDLDRVDANGFLQIKSIRKLSATCKTERNVLQDILKSRNIKHLNLQLDTGLLTEESGKLLSASESLRILHITAERGTILTLNVQMFPRNLKELEIWYCKIPDDPMPILEELQNLKVLRFVLSYDGETINCSSTAFPELAYLEMDGLVNLKNWNVAEGGFPKLETLGVYNCPLLGSIPVKLPPNIIIYCIPDPEGRVVKKFRDVTKGLPGYLPEGRRPIVPSSF